MATASIEKYVALRAELLKEKAALESRLARVSAALDGSLLKAATETAAPARRRRRRKRARNKLSLREAALQVAQGRPMTRQEILAAVQKLGYRFKTDNPLNSLGVVLYNKKYFKNQAGKFSPVK